MLAEDRALARALLSTGSHFVLSLPCDVWTVYFSHQKKRQRLRSEIENFPQSPSVKKCQNQDLIPTDCPHIHRWLLLHLLVLQELGLKISKSNASSEVCLRAGDFRQDTWWFNFSFIHSFTFQL